MPSLKSKQPLAKASEIADRFIALVPAECHIAGSIRRGKAEVGDIDIVSVGSFTPSVPGAEFISGKEVLRTYLFEGTQVNVMIAQPGAVGAMLLYATGSGGFGTMLRVKAKKAGFKLNRYGLFDRETGKLIAAESEQEIFTALGKRYYHPTERR